MLIDLGLMPPSQDAELSPPKVSSHFLGNIKIQPSMIAFYRGEDHKDHWVNYEPPKPEYNDNNIVLTHLKYLVKFGTIYQS